VVVVSGDLSLSHGKSRITRDTGHGTRDKGGNSIGGLGFMRGVCMSLCTQPQTAAGHDGGRAYRAEEEDLGREGTGA
jgi:hypothetical protein